jgi:ATP-binding cassette subfamily B protein
MSEPPTDTSPPADSNHQPADLLPDDLRSQVLSTAPGEIRAASAIDLDNHGSYTEAYLVLADHHLGHYVREGTLWQGQWWETSTISSTEMVEGLGMNMLRLLADGRSLAEFRFTLRHAKTVARIQRLLDRDLDAEEGQSGQDDQAPPPGEEKKVRCEQCGRVIPAWAEACPSCTSRRRILWRLLDYVRPYRGMAILGMVLAAVFTGLELLQPWLYKLLINRALGASEAYSPSFRLVLYYVGLLAGLILVRSIGRMVQMRLIFILGISITRDLRKSIYTHLHRLSLSFFAKKQTGGLVTRVTNDTERIWQFVAFTAIEIVLSFLTIFGVGIAMVVMYWRLALLVLLPVPIMLVLMVLFHQKMHHIFHRMWHRRAQMTAVIADALPGVRVIKAFSQEDREVDRFARKSTAVYDEERTFIGLWATFGPIMMLASQIGLVIVWLAGGWWVVQGSIEVGTLVAFSAYMGMFLRPIHMIAHMDERLNRAATSAQRIFEILDTEPAIYSKRGAEPGDRLAGKIELRDVSFSYDGIRKVLKNVSLTIQPGEMIGLAGPSGGGKTTLTNLICRFYDVLEGRILIDDKDVRDYDITRLRRRIGVVLQEPFLFHGTVAENIAYGHADASLDDVIEAARAANAHDFIVGFPDGYDTLVGERGQSLSGGDRQRISIARAILNDPAILILDEATSSVDTETEKLIQQALDRLVANRTTIAIAHRLSTLRKADRLAILDKGELVELGTHEELAGREDGLYAKLVRMQTEMQSIMAV